MRTTSVHWATARRLTVAAAAAAGLGFAAYEAMAQQTPPPQQEPGGLATTAATCRAKSEADCGVTEGCVWIPGFKVPNGTEVPGYCRPAPRGFKARRGTQENAPH